MTGEQYLLQTVFFEPRPFTPRLSSADEGAICIAAPRRNANPSGACRIRGSGTGMLNNEARELNDYRIERFELGRYFDVFLSSCYLGLRKPDPKIFELALDVLQRDAEEVAFIDDRQHNCDAAEALGIHAIRYQDEAQCVQALEQLGLDAGVRT
jgi:putative hydrolase of the HAD superfamily